MKFLSYIRFIFTKRLFIIIGFLAFIGVFWWVSMTNGKPVNPTSPTITENLNWWAKWADPIIGAGTFILAVVIGWIQLKEDWEESLEKRLTVTFKYQGRIIMLCKKAYLAAEGDIRNLGQQIGGQMAESRALKFKANHIRSIREGVTKNEFDEKSFYLHYKVEFELTELPPKVKFQTHNLIWHEPDNSVLTNLIEWEDLNPPPQTEDVES